MGGHQLKPDFQPAVLRENSYRWYIEYHYPNRKRPTFGLNRILNINDRRKRGYELCDLLNWWMSAGLTIERFTETDARRRKAEASRSSIAPRGHTDIRRAIYHAIELKEAILNNEDSSRSYKSHGNLFVGYLEDKNLELLPVDEIQRHHIVAFLDSRKIVDKVRNSTINNNITSLNALFEMMRDRGFVVENPCKNIKKLPAEVKLRRPFTLTEAKLVIPYIYKHDPLLLLAILMEFCCYMRPKEIRQTRRKCIDLEKGIIEIPANVGKTGRKIGGRVATIPLSFLDYFIELVPTCKQNNYIFGIGFKPDQLRHCNKNRLYRRHKKQLLQLENLGILEDLTGLTLYSWKDTGITEALEYIDLLAVQDQAGHTKPSMTQVYRKKPEINQRIREMRNDLWPKKSST